MWGSPEVPAVFATAMDLNVRPSPAPHPGAIAWYARHEIRPHDQHCEPCDSGASISFSYAAAKVRAREYQTYDGDRASKRLAGDGITANAVAPGPTETALFRANNPHASEGEARRGLREPLHRHSRQIRRCESRFLQARPPPSSQVRRCSWLAVQASEVSNRDCGAAHNWTRRRS